MTDEAKTPVVYIDANPCIYFIDGQEDVADRMRPFFALLAERPGVAMTSELTLAEVLAKATPVERRSYLNLIVWSNLFQHFRCQVFLSADEGLKVPADMALLQPNDSGLARLNRALA